jgi:hypothetical protein
VVVEAVVGGERESSEVDPAIEIRVTVTRMYFTSTSLSATVKPSKVVLFTALYFGAAEHAERRGMVRLSLSGRGGEAAAVPGAVVAGVDDERRDIGCRAGGPRSGRCRSRRAQPDDALIASVLTRLVPA